MKNSVADNRLSANATRDRRDTVSTTIHKQLTHEPQSDKATRESKFSATNQHVSWQYVVPKDFKIWVRLCLCMRRRLDWRADHCAPFKVFGNGPLNYSSCATLSRSQVRPSEACVNSLARKLATQGRPCTLLWRTSFHNRLHLARAIQPARNAICSRGGVFLPRGRSRM